MYRSLCKQVQNFISYNRVRAFGCRRMHGMVVSGLCAKSRSFANHV